MKKDEIVYIKIDETGKLHVKPKFTKFPMIYRSATEVHWNREKQTLYSPKPRDWSYFEWYQHIINVVKASTILNITDKTEWINIPNELKSKINDSTNKQIHSSNDNQL